MSRPLLVTLAVGALVSALGCSSSSSDAEPASTSSCEAVTIDRFKELVIVDEAVLQDARSKNATTGTWSFRHHIEHLVPQGADTSAFMMAWLDNWATSRTLNGYPLDKPNESRDAAMLKSVVCPWLLRTPANACDATCGTCAARRLDLSLAPFRLIAIANRIDQREENLSEPSGEGRFVYALTTGAGDDPVSVPKPMTVILEYELPKSRTTKQWAESWHALGQFASLDEPYRAALETLTNGFTARDSAPERRNGSALAQVRTNESALDWIWQLREFGIADDGNLKLRPVRNTPAESFNRSPALRDWINANANALLSTTHEVPLSMRAGAADQLLYSWSIPGVDEKLRTAFAANTCNGCHSTEHPSVDTAFHISPFRKGIAKLSPFMHDPAGKPDTLGLRAESMRRALCAN